MATRKKIDIIKPDTSIDFVADEGRVVQVLINLLSNSLKFSKSGTTITIDIIQSPDYLEFRASDQGRGIASEQQKAVFERYKQTEKADETEKGGSGLGLYICKMIVEAHKGTIGVESEVGKGSTFWFRLEIVK